MIAHLRAPRLRPARAWTMLPSGPKSRIAPGFFRPAPRLRLGALVRVPPAPFLRPRRTVRGLPACCSWRQSWGSARFGTTIFTPRLSPKRLREPSPDLRRGRGTIHPAGLHPCGDPAEPVCTGAADPVDATCVEATELFRLAARSRAALLPCEALLPVGSGDRLDCSNRPRGCVTAAKLRRSVARLVRLRGVHRIPCLLALRSVRRGDTYASFDSGHPGTSRLCSTAGAVPPAQHCC